MVEIVRTTRQTNYQTEASKNLQNAHYQQTLLKKELKELEDYNSACVANGRPMQMEASVRLGDAIRDLAEKDHQIAILTETVRRELEDHQAQLSAQQAENQLIHEKQRSSAITEAQKFTQMADEAITALATALTGMKTTFKELNRLQALRRGPGSYPVALIHNAMGRDLAGELDIRGAWTCTGTSVTDALKGKLI
ncbi:hypothetical protein A0J51_03281 [Gluconobacter japonicus]|nr:hypothetical protein A0J51_03281 [Gluconobacter japonicus]